MIRRTVVIYSLYLAQFVKTRLEYKWNFFASLVSSALISASGLLFILILLDGETVNALRGWNRNEVLFIYGYSFLSTALFGMLAPNLYQFGDRYIIKGQFDRVLLRPLNSLSQVLFESFNLDSIGNIALGAVVITIVKERLGLVFSV